MTVEVWLSGHEENFTRKAIESYTKIAFPSHAGIDMKNKKDWTGVCHEICRPNAGPETQKQ